MRETTISTVVDQNVLEDMILHSTAFESVITHMEQDNRELVEMSYTDPLTKLNNRRAFDRYFQTTVAEHLVTGLPLESLAGGHRPPRNSTTPMATASAIRPWSRWPGKLMGYGKKYATTPNRAFFPARYGGEEFVVVLGPGLDVREAAEDAENLRAIIEGV